MRHTVQITEMVTAATTPQVLVQTAEARALELGANRIRYGTFRIYNSIGGRLSYLSGRITYDVCIDTETPDLK